METCNNYGFAWFWLSAVDSSVAVGAVVAPPFLGDSIIRAHYYAVSPTHIGIPTMESVKLLQLCTGLCSRSKKHTWLLHLQQQVPGSTGNNFYRQHHEALTLTPVSMTTERCPV